MDETKVTPVSPEIPQSVGLRRTQTDTDSLSELCRIAIDAIHSIYRKCQSRKKHLKKHYKKNARINGNASTKSLFYIYR